MIALNTKVRLILLSLLALVLLGLLVMGILRIRSEARETARLASLSEQAVKEEVILEAIRTLQESSKEEIETFETLALSDESLVPVIESIESVSRALDLDTEIVSVDKKEGESGGAQIVSIVIESEGSWDGLFSLMKAIESLPNRVMIEEESITKVGSLWHGKVAFSLYSFN